MAAGAAADRVTSLFDGLGDSLVLTIGGQCSMSFQACTTTYAAPNGNCEVMNGETVCFTGDYTANEHVSTWQVIGDFVLLGSLILAPEAIPEELELLGGETAAEGGDAAISGLAADGSATQVMRRPLHV